MSFDIEKIRKDTPGLENVIHLNNAGAALMPRPVIHAIQQYFEREVAIGGYEAAYECHEELKAVYQELASFLGCFPEEIALTENATRAWDMLFYSIPFLRGDRILTSMAEYSSNYVPFLQIKKKFGVKIDVVPNDEHGQISIKHLEQMLDERVRLVSLTHVPSSGGLVNPAKAVGEVLKNSSALYLLDACQSIGQMPVDIQDIECDMLTGVSRKFLRGPRGVGFLTVKKEVLEKFEPPMLGLDNILWTSEEDYELLPTAQRFETFEGHYAGRIGLGAALRYAGEVGIETIWERIQILSDSLRAQLLEIPGIALCDLGETQCGIVTFIADHCSPKEIQRYLFRKNINVGVSEKEHTHLDMNARGLSSMVRASVHYYNQEEELEEFCSELKKIIAAS